MVTKKTETPSDGPKNVGVLKGRDGPYMRQSAEPGSLTVHIDFELYPAGWVQLTLTEADLEALLARVRAGGTKKENGNGKQDHDEGRGEPAAGDP